MGDGGQVPTSVGRARSKRRHGRGRFSFLSIFSIVWMRDLLIATALALGIIAFVYQPVKVEGNSMTPELADQERIFINKFVYKFGTIERGDIVVFRYPRDPSKSFIKRVVGLGGEVVEIRRGVVYVNGIPLREGYVASEDHDLQSYPLTRVPPDHYFVLGDRRRSSHDSRSWGTVHRDFIYGKAVFAYWPIDHFGPIRSAGEEE